MAGRFVPGKLIAWIVTLIGALAGAVAIWQYYISTTPFDISGAWTIEDKIQQTSYRPYEGASETFSVNFTQNGTRFTGAGNKSSFAGKTLIGAARTPIEIRGTVDRRGRIHATFVSKGELRQSSGGLDWQVSKDPNRWTVTFNSDAAAESGSSILRR